MSAALARLVQARLVSVALLAAVALACGKKGPPLAPLISLPVAPADVSARRADDAVDIRFRVPEANVSGVRPADVSRVDVYAWTGDPLTPDQLFRHATVVASVPVRRPPPPPAEGDTPPVVTTPPEPGLDQGAVAEVREQLGPEVLAPLELPDAKAPAVVKDAPLALSPPDLGPVMKEVPPRRYVAVGVNRRGRRGPPATAVVVPLWASPRPPGDPTVGVSEKAVTLEWTAPQGVRVSIHPPNLAKPPAPRPPASGAAGRPAQPAAPPDGSDVGLTPAPDDAPADEEVDGDDPDLADPAVDGDGPDTADTEADGQEGPDQKDLEAGVPGPQEAPARVAGKVLPSRLLHPWPDGATGYRVYEVLPSGADPPDTPPPPAQQPYPRLLTPKLLTVTTFVDPRVEFGTERCYVVRTVETVGPLSAESAPSAPVCVEPRDVFPPAAPQSLGAVASEGAISLIWERNTEADLAGYIILRSEAPGDPVQPITPEPIEETTYRDTNVTPGTRYVYVVVAVDGARPPNASPPSNRVEETAR